MPSSFTSPHSIADLLEIMHQLRTPETGCPWDLKQTHESLLNYLIEESYEFIEAVENKDLPNMIEELGDVLLQVVFHAQLAKERGDFNFENVVDTVSKKLVSRHPHVFGELKLADAAAVEVKWDELKKAEKKETVVEDEGILGRMPRHLPALLKSEKIQKRASQIGFDWPDFKGPMEKVKEELEELRVEATATVVNTEKLEEEFGDLLFAVVKVGLSLKLNPEQALAKANQKFVRRFTQMESDTKAEQKELKNMSLDEMDVYWEKAKQKAK